MKIVMITTRKIRTRADFKTYCEALITEAGHPSLVIGEFWRHGKAVWNDGDCVTEYELIEEE